MHKQKGTGGSRKGSIKNPLFKGGARIFGPRPRSYDFKLNKKVKTLAKYSALSTKVQGNSIELMLYDLKTKVTIPLTNNSALNLEPRWSNDGRTIAFVSTIESKHFLLYKAVIENNALSELTCLTPDRKSSVKRYYYSAFDHAINPAWHPDGKRLYFVSNNEIIHGTGDIVAFDTDSLSYPKTILHEETSWRTKPDVSPDGSRLVYSSYLGRNWQQLWMIPATGGYPMPLTYGNYDNTCPRWSPDGKKIAFISNRTGNTSLWMLDVFDVGIIVSYPMAVNIFQGFFTTVKAI